MTHNPDKHFVIVQGISGTGKSSLAKAYAYAVLGLGSLSEETVRFVRVPVEPQWTDPSFLLGYEDVLSRGNYRRTEFQDALLLAWRDPTQPVFVLLDEMNRAQIEYYFSTLLSAMEIGGSITFHTAPEAVDASIPASIPWPRNVFFIGAINDDESTSPISPMVLDRANTIDLSSFDVREYCAWLAQSEPGVAVVVKDETVVGTLEKAWQILEPYGLQFGKRTVRELAMYVARSHAVAPGSAGLDDQIVQKILPKVSGTEDHYEMLVHLSRALEDFPRSHAAVLRMQDQLARTGSFKV